MRFNYKLEYLPVGLSIYIESGFLPARYRFLFVLQRFNLTSKLAPLQTSESTSEVDTEKVTRIRILRLFTCIASYGSAVGSGDKHLVIVWTFNVSTFQVKKRSREQQHVHTSKTASSDVQCTRGNYLKVKLAILGKTHNSGSSPTAS
jgi:hypothetical protein